MNPAKLRQTVVIEKYSTFTVHDNVTMAMQDYYKDVNWKLDPSVPIYEHEHQLAHICDKGTTEYTSHYAHHAFKVSIKRNTDRYLQVSASIITTFQKEPTEKTRREESAIYEIALKGIIRLIQEHGNAMRDFEDEVERLHALPPNTFESENQDYYAEMDAKRQRAERKEELAREHQEEGDEMYAAYLDDLSCGGDDYAL